ncbi:hypothetical protein AWC38_SpisGene13159 [Stylophora pistillata]|uniref:Uncharacterized protein n=1 Tax=Stylophora pistillata TaxID=50429 RepID=A0A2B4RZV5_STYPI|nr:hypothetical protein AWC38_SpisGene13159 [Stylophora pistillata]
MGAESNINERVLLAMKKAEGRMIRQKETWQQKKEEFIKARAAVLEKLHQVLTQVYDESGILLIKPKDLVPRLEEIKEDVKEISEEDILAAANIPKLRAKLRTAELQAQEAAEKEAPLSDVEGTCATRERGQKASWKVGEIMSSFPSAVVTTPRLLDMDINRSRYAAKEILFNVSKASGTSKSISLPPMGFFPLLNGYYKQPNIGILKTKSEPPQLRKKTFRPRVTCLPPIATLYPEDDQGQDS